MINLGNVTIEGVQESLIRDNVIDADGSLLDRAFAQLIGPFKTATYNKAKELWMEVAHSESVPELKDEDAMIAWYLSRPGYKDADMVEAERVAAEAAAAEEVRQAKIAELNDRIAAVQENLDHELTDPESTQVESLQTQIAELEAERDAL